MSKLNGREVVNLRLHTVMHIPSIGQMGPAIDADSAKGVKAALKMFKEIDGVLLKGKTWEAFIPNGNIVCMQLKPE